MGKQKRVKKAIKLPNPIEDEEFYGYIGEAVEDYGGFFNAHLHLDRAGTLKAEYLEHASMDPIEASSEPLRVKQNLTGEMHKGPAYAKANLIYRIEKQLDKMIKQGTRRCDSLIDVSYDDGVGLTALEAALKAKKNKKNKIDFRVAAYPIFGFKDEKPERWDLFEEAAKKADYIGCLPERDCEKTYPDHIGFVEHFRRTLNLAIKLGKPIHYHVDQKNDPSEKGTETLIEAVKWLGSPDIGSDEPSVWAVHVISPSAYDEERFQRLLYGLKKYNIGVICCPSAGVSMWQDRSIMAPTHNSIARVLDMLLEEIPVRIGSDNVSDVFLPATVSNLYMELFMISHALRISQPDILAKLACGKELNDMDRERVRRAI
jgi:cytosine/adenosine deaminase-related metal-dependent hydrolase